MLNAQSYHDKKVRALIKERRSLWRRQYDVFKLDEPIQRGWKRFHAFTPEALRRPDAERLAEILRRIGTTVVHPDRTFLRRKGRGRRKRMVEIQQPLQVIPVDWQGRLALPEVWQKYFRIEQRLNWKKRFDVWVFKYPYLFELRMEPNLYWHVRIPNPDIESRLSEIDRWLEHHQGQHRYDWLKGRSSARWYRDDVRDRITRREVKFATWQALRGEVDSRARTPCPPTSRPSAAPTLRSRSPTAEAAGLNPDQCRCNPDREYSLSPV